MQKQNDEKQSGHITMAEAARNLRLAEGIFQIRTQTQKGLKK